MQDHELIRLVDVGAMGGLQGEWFGVTDRLWPVLFEPNKAEASKLTALMANVSKATIVEKALSNKDGSVNLYITRNPTCISVLEPNEQFLADYGIREHFAVIGREQIDCARYDTLHRHGVVPAPDVIKIDVQGYEFEVLLGFGGLLQSCMAIKLETHLYPLYRGQRLLGDLVSLLAGFGMVLRRIEQDKLSHFHGNLVEIDAYFTRDREAVRSYDAAAMEKFRIICDTLGVPPYTF